MYKTFKRLFDFIIALIVFIFLLPIFILISIILKFTGEGEIFYFQKRIGYHNQYFHIWKFATMLKNSMTMGSGSITLRNDDRVLPFGKFLRITKINELPQIINVLKGDMSIVGPRPLVDKTFKAYSLDVQSTIYNVLPGITGIGSIVFRDEEQLISSSNKEPHTYYTEVIAPYKGELEIWYQKNQSFITDLKIIFATVWVILLPKSQAYYSWFTNIPKRNF